MPEVGNVKPVWLNDEVRMDFCWIPKGQFRMGSRDGYPYEQPVHLVRIEKGFWLARTPVTQQQYGVCFPEHENHFSNKPNHPAESMSWHDARRFCQWLTEIIREAAEWQGRIADLPTETQWEYACRAGTESDYYTGDGEQALMQAGWYGEDWETGSTQPVRQKAQNAFGLYDMHGNVDEWCRDRWTKDAYRHSAYVRIEPAYCGDEARVAEDGGRSLRGGAWGDPAGICRSAFRVRFHPGIGVRSQGFRVGLFPGPSCPGAEPE